MKEPSKIPPKKKDLNQLKFEKSIEHYTDRDLMVELLYSNWVVQNKIDRNRSNTSKLVWFVVIGILLSLLSSVFIGGLL